jgi:serine/threonine-protein kinase
MIGEQVGNYRITELLGEGGMGVVYKAVDIHLDRPVAVKMLNKELSHNADIVERFRSEAKAQANLNHVNLATLFAFLVENGNAFMVMEFVEGETFDKKIRTRGPLPPEEAVPWFKQALLGIGAAHRMGIIHRDIKPANIMVNRAGIVKVMDFGIAKVIGDRGRTRTGMLIGTPAYMSPEQIQNRQIDVRSDIYALGITLYQMLTGHLPFDNDNDFDVMNSQVTLAPPPLKRMHPYAPDQYQNVVLKALEKDPNNRFQTVEEFGSALEHPERVTTAAATQAPPVATAPGVRPTVLESPISSYGGSAAQPARSSAAPPAYASAPPTPTPPAMPPTVLEQPTATGASSGSYSPTQMGPQTTMMAKKDTKKRYMLAGGVAVAAVILLSILVFARKPPVAQVQQVGTSTSGPANSPLVPAQAEVSGDPSSILGPGGGSGGGSAQGGTGTDAVNPGNRTPTPPPPPNRSDLRSSRPGKKGSPQGSQGSGGGGAAPQQGGMSQAEVDELEHRIDQLTSHAAALNSSLNNLQQQMSRQGLGLRHDLVEAQASMQTNLNKADGAMQRGDYGKAKSYADLAEANAKIIDQFFGH